MFSSELIDDRNRGRNNRTVQVVKRNTTTYLLAQQHTFHAFARPESATFPYPMVQHLNAGKGASTLQSVPFHLRGIDLGVGEQEQPPLP